MFRVIVPNNNFTVVRSSRQCTGFRKPHCQNVVIVYLEHTTVQVFYFAFIETGGCCKCCGRCYIAASFEDPSPQCVWNFLFLLFSFCRFQKKTTLDNCAEQIYLPTLPVRWLHMEITKALVPEDRDTPARKSRITVLLCNRNSLRSSVLQQQKDRIFVNGKQQHSLKCLGFTKHPKRWSESHDAVFNQKDGEPIICSLVCRRLLLNNFLFSRIRLKGFAWILKMTSTTIPSREKSSFRKVSGKSAFNCCADDRSLNRLYLQVALNALTRLITIPSFNEN